MQLMLKCGVVTAPTDGYRPAGLRPGQTALKER